MVSHWCRNIQVQWIDCLNACTCIDMTSSYCQYSIVNIGWLVVQNKRAAAVNVWSPYAICVACLSQSNYKLLALVLFATWPLPCWWLQRSVAPRLDRSRPGTKLWADVIQTRRLARQVSRNDCDASIFGQKQILGLKRKCQCGSLYDPLEPQLLVLVHGTRMAIAFEIGSRCVFSNTNRKAKRLAWSRKFNWLHDKCTSLKLANQSLFNNRHMDIWFLLEKKYQDWNFDFMAHLWSYFVRHIVLKRTNTWYKHTQKCLRNVLNEL